ncbi:hypothetical protein QFW96_20890 [Saccharopolyspora sp. TS4A08]|uniref:DUF916 domain-containing protein n=1 Tax=Saccharopolyspora ipomoeae TaxID=3042027 RepID=A0ABT6PSY8_9PSEU|nr:hypothetical protein [Saccharopolyspora sp. TS4A08]MDI2031101.1 hypothetical protein [Saccharopolyspora sp. TS4A08]
MAVVMGAGGPSTAAAESDPSAPVTFGIKLLDAPLERQADPRANTYIVDHLPPGSTIQRRVQVTNETNRPQRFELYPGAASVDGGVFAFGQGRQVNELATWVRLDRPVLDLPPHGVEQVLATITIPRDASRGERYGVIWAEHTTPPTPEANVGFVNRVAFACISTSVPAANRPRISRSAGSPLNEIPRGGR